LKGDLIESVIVLPSKIFYGNSVPACLVILNKRKAPERKGKVLLIWASRNFQSDNPQNILRRADCLRILVPWRAFGDPERCRSIIPEQKSKFIAEIEHERDVALADIKDAYAAFLDPLPRLRQELIERETFATKEPPSDKAERKTFREEKKANAERLKAIKRELKALEKLEVEAEEKKTSVAKNAVRATALVEDACRELLDVCSDPEQAGRYFVVADRPEIEGNEFNLNLPRYVDTYEPEEPIEICDALQALTKSESNHQTAMSTLRTLLRADGAQ
jgi:type I restriction enzyme M protein